MDISLPFITQSRKKKRKYPATREAIKVQSEHTPIEIQNMDMPQLEYMYQYGTPDEKETANKIIILRKKWNLITLPNDDILPQGSGAPGVNHGQI
jgi:hypothetical protein